MKNFITTLALASCLFASCDRGQVDMGDRKTIGFNFRVAGDFDPATREATLYSTDAIQNIAVAKVYVFQTTDNGATYNYVKTYDFDNDWIQGNNSVTKSLEKVDMLPNGKYRFLAVGADNNTDFTLPAMVVGTTEFKTVAAQLAGAKPQELFAGYSDEAFDTSVESVTIIMHRRVSGVLLYVKNVPTTVSVNSVKTPVGYLRLSIAAAAQTINITDGNPADTTPYPASQPGYDVINVDLSAQGDSNADGFYDGKTIGGGVAQVPGSTIVGAYIIPGLHSAIAQPTMVLKLVGNDGATVLQSWNVKNSASGATTYDIKSNYIYSIGRKLKAANTTNGTDDTDTDDDAPIDLFKSQVIDARINSGWEQVVQMMLDDK